MSLNELPPVHQTDDYLECINKGQKYCMVVAKINPNDSSIWKNLEESDLTYKLDRRFIHRGLCLSEDQNIIKQTTNLLNSQLYSHNLSSSIDELHCLKWSSTVSTIDILFPLVVFALFCCVIIGTLLDTEKKKYNNILEKTLVKFSLKENWKKITNTDGNEDFNRLKSIQGIRVFTNVSIIIVHAALVMTMSFYHNPELLELIFTSTFLRLVSAYTMFLVHIFLVISAFLFSNQVFSHHEKNGSFTFKDFLILVINRYFRLYVAIFPFVVFSRSSLIIPFLGVPSMRIYYLNRQACIENWTWTMLFSNNFLSFDDTCYPTSWYLAADFQAYVILVLLIYVVLKYKLNPMKVMIIALISSAICFGMVIYVTHMKTIVLNYSFKDFQLSRFQDSRTLWIMYTAIFSTMPTSIVGVIFGYLYFRTKKLQIKEMKPIYQIIWSIIFFGLPGIAMYLPLHRYNRLLTAILGSIIKVLFTTGVAVGILGMSFGLGGKIRKYLEGKYNIFLGNISFSVYLFNFTIMMISNAGRSDVHTLDLYFVVTNVLKDLLLSLLAGLLLSLAIEQPALSIQKMLLPQLRKNFVEPKKKE